MNTLESAMKTAWADTLRRWQTMSGADEEEAEETAEGFEAAFYRFIEAMRVWANSLQERPNDAEELLAHPALSGIIEQLPGPLLLNLETEAELVLEGIVREEEDKVD